MKTPKQLPPYIRIIKRMMVCSETFQCWNGGTAEAPIIWLAGDTLTDFGFRDRDVVEIDCRQGRLVITKCEELKP